MTAPTLTDGEALLRAVLDEPGDDLHRLAYADWCEENGRPERAEFVRATGDGVWGAFCGCYKDFVGLVGAPPGLEFCGFGRESSDGRPYLRFGWWQEGRPRVQHNLWAVFGRGFLHTVRCPLDAWREHGPALVRSHPVERVEVTDREPTRLTSATGRDYDHWVYGRGAPLDTFPADRRLPGWLLPSYVAARYATEAAARDALSRACLRWAHLPEELR